MGDYAFRELAIVGVGLLGGSLGLACKETKLCEKIVGIGRSQEHLDDALAVGAVDTVTTDLVKGVSRADLIVLCTPVRHIVSIIPQVMRAAKHGAIVTDVGSTKGSITAAGEAVTPRRGGRFVGSHPMAGSEHSGVRHARPNLFAGSTCFVTKTPRTDLAAFARICRFWQELDSRVVIVRPDRHDRLVALISHLPHLLAVALVRAVDASGEDRNLIRGIIGNGFRDTTRIAHGHPALWRDIFSENRSEIGRVTELLRNALDDLMAGMEAPEERLEPLLEQASQYRGFLDHR